MIDHPDVLEQLAERIDELEKRVSRLEHPLPAAVADAVATPVAATFAEAQADESPSMGASLTVVGKALLGIAGAYVLRAFSGAGAVSRLVIAAIAVVYAVAWLVVASRSAARSRFAGIFYVATSALILAPMLWEMCLRFQAMQPSIAAFVLAAYVAIAAALAVRTEVSAAIAVAFAASALTALALSVATHDMLPFTAILLAMALLVEVARMRGSASPVAAIVYLAADLDVWSLLFIYRAPADARPEYVALSPAVILAAPLLLFAIHLAGVAVHTFARRRTLTLADALQAMIAFSLVACGVLWITPSVSRIVLGVLCLGLGADCYWLFLYLYRDAAQKRTTRIFVVWALGLLAGGVFLMLPVSAAGAALGVVAVAAMVLSRRRPFQALRSQGVLLIVASAFASGLIQYASYCLVGQIPSVPQWPVVLAAACTVAAWVASAENAAGDFTHRIVPFAAVFVATCAVSALLIHVLVGVFALASAPGPAHIAVMRTVGVCALSLALAFGGSRLRRVTMTTMAYCLVAFVTAKLLFEDLRHGNLAFIAASICLVAVTFILVPRIAGRGRRQAGVAQ